MSDRPYSHEDDEQESSELDTQQTVICDSCPKMHSAELFNGHRRRGWCSVHGCWVMLGRTIACSDHPGSRKPKGRHPVELVRCEGCRHSIWQDGSLYCLHHAEDVEPGWFCNFGEAGN